MKVLEILGSQWAIEQSKLIEIQRIYAGHLHGESVDIAAVESRLGRKLDNTPAPYSIKNGVAIVPIEGVIAKRMNLLTQISGGTSSQLVSQNLAAAADDPRVHSIILAIDSPGGTVDGTQLLANEVLAIRKSKKQIVSLASGSMCSAAYWIGSAAQAVFIADGTTTVGSIGVVTNHTDISAAQSAQGLKTTEISAGKYKRISSQYGPLSKEGRQAIQNQLDYTYSIFVDAVAEHRGVSSQKVLANMADGRIFIGQQAIDAGLADGIRSMDALIAELNGTKGGNGSFAINTGPKRLPALMSLQEVTDRAKAMVKKNPGLNFVAAVKSIDGRHRYSVNRD